MTTHLRPVDAPDGSAAPMTLRVHEVAHWLRVPGRTGVLALTFSTAVTELADALVVLFDAMAETFWWVER